MAQVALIPDSRILFTQEVYTDEQIACGIA
jgi:hypothetical protein